MAIFSGKVIEAYYTNAENTCIEVLYREGEKAICYYIEPDMTDKNFMALIEEYPMDKISESTVQRNLSALRKLNSVVDAKVQQRLDASTPTSPASNFDTTMEFVINYDESKSAEDLFALKLKIFEMDSVKQITDNELKKQIRTAKTPMEVLVAYHGIVKK